MEPLHLETEIVFSPEMRTFEFVLPAGRRIAMSAPEHLSIPQHLEQNGVVDYEPDTLACAAAICSLNSGDFYDIGANVGVFSLFISGTLGRNCVAFEPTPEIASVLRQTALDNALPITCIERALSAERGKATFYLSGRADLSNSLNQAFRHSERGIEVEVDMLDNLVSSRPALLKIDTESTEPDVLEGAKKTISSFRPPMIIEVLYGRTEKRLNSFFATRSYHAYHISSKLRWQRRQDVSGDPRHKFNNWLLAPNPLGDDFWLHLDAWRWRLHAMSRIVGKVESVKLSAPETSTTGT